MDKAHVPPKVGVSDVLKHLWVGARPQRWLFYFTVCAFTLSSIISVIVPLIYKNFFDLLTNSEAPPLVIPELLRIITLVLILQGTAWFLFRSGMLMLNRVESGTMARLRQISFDYMIRHSYAFFANNFTGSLVQRVGRFSRSFERLYDTLVFSILPLIIHVIGAVIVVYHEQPAISYIICIWITGIFIFSYIFQKWKLPYDLIATKADSATTAALADAIGNQHTIMTFSNFNMESNVFRSVTDDQARKQVFAWNLGAIKDAVQAGFMVLIEFFIFYYAIRFWNAGTLSIGTFVLIQVYILGLSGRLWDFGRIVRTIYESFADSKEMVEILNTPYEITDVPRAKKLRVTQGAISFTDVSFGFDTSRTVLDGVNITIRGGEKVALIGPSGAGKSTIVKLLLRLYNVSSGTISIDEQNIQKVTQDSLRRNMSLVPQDPILFHRTLLENIRYGREDATDKEVIKAARLAHCDEFIESLPQKYDTYVGERGIKLSGGERQRVAIARAILKNAPILILDEATSSLDSHSETLIQDALDKLMRDKTTIVIAHRLSTIRMMDRVIVIDNGAVVEEGSHDELLARKESLYKNLWNLQAGGFLQEV